MEFQPVSKRPTCPNCSKPLALCLCTRLKTPNLDNKVRITILQHSLEKKHPLNSAKIARLGLQNVDVYTVTDVNFEAQFDIRPLGGDNSSGFSAAECSLGVCRNASECLESDESLNVERSRKRDFGQVGELDSGAGSVQVSDSELFSDWAHENVNVSVGFEGSSGTLAKEDDYMLKQSVADMVGAGNKISNGCGFSTSNVAMKRHDEPLMSITIGKQGSISHVSHQWKLRDDGKRPKLEHLFASPEAMEALAGGFVVKKLQKKQKNGCTELEQVEEFEITIPPGSALVFPTQNAVPAEAIDFEVKNLIVLDGTWSKAKRMYIENPWLRVLPSVRLDVEKTSLFGEVRQQPKAGYLSTIESIVYALEALGETEGLKGLDNLLEVFESMVEDQRRFKDEALMKLSST